MSEAFVLDTRKPDPARKTIRINDYAYHVGGLTRNVAKRLVGIQERAAAIKDQGDDVDPDELAGCLIEALDIRLQPENPGQKTAGDLLRELWDSEEYALTLDHLQSLQEVVNASVEDLARPPA